MSLKVWKIWQMYMNQENKKYKIGIIGHTKGIGKAIADLFKEKQFEVIGLSRSNGYDLSKNQQNIIDKINQCEYVVINAYAGNNQLRLLQKIYKKYQNQNKKIVVITSTSGTLIGIDNTHNTPTYKEYCRSKKELIEYIENVQQELVMKPLSIFDICPDTVDTEMSAGLWEEWPKLKADEVAEAVRYCFESKFNINKIVLQKNAS